MRVIVASLVAVLVVAAGCSSESTAEGQASYVKPADQGGQKVAPQENDEDLKLTVALEVSGSFEAVDALLCKLTSGSMTTEVSSSGSADSDGTYAASYDASASAASSRSPTCGVLKNTKLTSLTSVELDASLPANDENCGGFCQAKADGDCSASADKARCTADAKASCTTDCKGRSKIRGSGRASASAVAEANDNLDSEGNTTTKVDIVFDRFE